MKIAGKLNVGFVVAPLSGHSGRGTGTYSRNLSLHLRNNPAISITETDLKFLGPVFDIVHFPYFDPFFLTMPLPGTGFKMPYVVTVHDLIPLKYPDKFKKGIRGLFKWQLQKNSIVRASQIITDSEASRRDIIEITGIREDKVSAVYLGVSEEFRKISDSVILGGVSRKFALPRDFLLCVGDVNYNKNVLGLINSFNEISKIHNGLHLVLVGQGFVQTSTELSDVLKLVDKLNLSEKIIRLAGLSLSELVCVYNRAKILLLPSLDEGFGLPVLEAFACGTPVVASRIGSIEEISGAAAFLVSPGDNHEFALAINELLTDQELRVSLIEKGLRQVKKFTWEKCAEETVGIYKKALGYKDYFS